MWFSYALFFSICSSIAMLIAKKLLKNISPSLYFLISLSFSIPFFILAIVILGIPVFTEKFFALILICAIIDLIAGLLYFKSLEISEISLIAPIASFSPVFSLIFAWILLNEEPTPIKFVGIIIIMLGAYLLNLKDLKHGALTPIKKLFSNRGVQLFLITNMLWGLTPVFQKSAIFETSPNAPITVPLFEIILICVFLSPLFLKNIKITKNFSKTNFHLLLFLGIMTVLAQFAAITAFSLTHVAYASAVFRLSTLFSVLIGAVFLKEKNIQQRFIGATVMVIGTVLIAI